MGNTNSNNGFDPMSLLSPGIGTASQIGSTLLNEYFNRRTTEDNRRYAEGWRDEERAYNSPSAAKQRMMDAGYNPMLMQAGMSPISSQSATSASPYASQQTMSQMNIDPMAMAQIRKLNVDADSSQEDVLAKRIDNKWREVSHIMRNKLGGAAYNNFQVTFQQQLHELGLMYGDQTLDCITFGEDGVSVNFNDFLTLGGLDNFEDGIAPDVHNWFQYASEGSLASRLKQSGLKISETQAKYIDKQMDIVIQNLKKAGVNLDDIHKLNEFRISMNDSYGEFGLLFGYVMDALGGLGGLIRNVKSLKPSKR